MNTVALTVVALLLLALSACGDRVPVRVLPSAQAPAGETNTNTPGHTESEEHEEETAVPRTYTVTDLHTATSVAVTKVKTQTEGAAHLSIETAIAKENIRVQVRWTEKRGIGEGILEKKRPFLCHYHGSKMACHAIAEN